MDASTSWEPVSVWRATVHLAALDADLLGEGHHGQAELGGEHLGHGAGVAVGGLDAGEHQVVVAGLADGGGQDLGGVERAGAGDGVVGHEHGLGRTHGERRPQTGRLVPGGHGHEGDLAAAGLVDQLERHLDPVGVGLVQDELYITLEGEVSVQGAGIGGIRDLLHADDHVESHAVEFVSSTCARSNLPTCQDRGHRARAPDRQHLRLVGDRPVDGGHPQGLLRRPRRHVGGDLPPGQRVPSRPGRGQRGLRRGGRDGRRRHAQRGGQRPGRHRHRARRPARRLDQRLRPHHRPAQRPHRGHRRAARRPGQGVDPARRARVGQRPLLPVPHRPRLRRRRGRAGRAPLVAQALRRPPAVRVRRVRHLVPPLRPLPPADGGEAAATAR